MGYCDVCRTRASNINRHNLTLKHIKLSSNNQSNEQIEEEEEGKEEIPMDAAEQEEPMDDAEQEEEENKEDPEFLNELSNENWKPTEANASAAEVVNRKEKKNSFFDMEIPDLYSDRPSGIVGKTRRRLLTKIAEYKKSFPEILGKFRIKKNANEQELQEYLDECVAISEMDSVSQFVSTIAIAALNGLEKASTRTSFNVTGLTSVLQQDPEFNKCMKQLCLKYSSFVSMPPEYRMILIIASTSVILVSHNARMAQNIDPATV